jgi:hypothetical protein
MAYHFSGQGFSNTFHRISDNEGLVNRIFYKITTTKNEDIFIDGNIKTNK